MEKATTGRHSVYKTGCFARYGSKWLATARRYAMAPLLLVVCFAVGSDSAAAKNRNTIIVADTSSPRATLESFIDGCNDISELIHTVKYLDRTSPDQDGLVERILDCLDTSELPAFTREQRASEAAVCLKEILDRVELPPWDEIPGTEEIEQAGGFEKLSHWRIPGTRITISRVAEGPHRHEYLFSPGTVERSLRYFKQIQPKEYRAEGDGPEVSPNFYQWFVSVPGHPALASIVSLLPEWMQRGRTWGLANWKWPGLFIMLLIAIIPMVAAYKLQAFLNRRWEGKGLARYWLTLIFPIAAMLVPLAFGYVTQNYLTVRGAPLYILSFLSTTATFLAALVVVFGVTKRIAESIIASPQINPHGLNAQLIRIVSQTFSIIASVTLFMAVGQYLGIPVATLLAGAGIGGVALAFGAQDTLKTLFGTVMLMADKPFRVGERIIFGKYEGMVEDIGLRSTKIRLLTGHQVTVPNGELAGTDIENVGRRPHIRKTSDIHIPLDTPREKLEKAIAIIRAALDNHEGMDPEFPPRVFFTDFMPAAFKIQVIYWYNPPKYWDFLAFSEKINLEIVRAFEEQEIPFSLPFRVTYTSRDSNEAPIEVRMVDGQDAP